VKFRIDMTRKTFDGLCAFLNQWGTLYAMPGAVVLRASVRSERQGRRASGVVDSISGLGDAASVSKRYNVALCGLGRAKVMKNTAVVDLRDLTEAEIEAIVFVAQCAVLKASQQQAVERIEAEVTEFLKLPAMMRLAVAAVD
jgi:hypothetical protein